MQMAVLGCRPFAARGAGTGGDGKGELALSRAHVLARGYVRAGAQLCAGAPRSRREGREEERLDGGGVRDGQREGEGGLSLCMQRVCV